MYYSPLAGSDQVAAVAYPTAFMEAAMPQEGTVVDPTTGMAAGTEFLGSYGGSGSSTEEMEGICLLCNASL